MNHGAQAPAPDDSPHQSSSEQLTSTGTNDGAAPSSSVAGVQPDSSHLWTSRLADARKTATTTLFTSLDSIALIEFAVLYCLDLSLPLLLLRSTLHLSLHHHHAAFPLLPTELRSRVPATASLAWVIFVNFICLLWHLFFTLPQAGEATHFCLHGHLLVDFVGQRALVGWGGRARLVVLDVLVGGLQCLACGVVVGLKKGGGTGVMRRTVGNGPGLVARQEEGEEGIEMQTLRRRGQSEEDTSDEIIRVRTPNRRRGGAFREGYGEYAPERANEPGTDVEAQAETADDSRTARSEEDAHEALESSGLLRSDAEEAALRSLERLRSGQAILVDLRFWPMLRDQWYERRNRPLAGRV